MRHDLDPDRSRVHVHATSSVHPIDTSAPLSGWVDLTTTDDGALDPDADVAGRVSVPLGAMRSGNPLVDREADRRLDVARHPEVVGALVSLRPDGSDGLVGTGRLTFHGVTRDVEGALRITRTDAGELHLAGELALDVTDFGVQPPSLLVVKVHRDITVVLDAVARPA